jgi:hypothetical protein
VMTACEFQIKTFSNPRAGVELTKTTAHYSQAVLEAYPILSKLDVNSQAPFHV